jgi:uncharacterized membrane protein SirB2
MDPILGITMRWLHTTSVAIVLGGFFFIWFGARGAMPHPRRFRSAVIVAITVLLGSGLYNLLTKTSLPPGYHMWFGMKALLVLHVIAVAIIATNEGLTEARRARLAAGIVFSGVAIFAISSYLRWITLHP